MSGRYGKGYRPDPPQERARRVGLRAFMATPVLPASASLLHATPAIKNQYLTSACTGFAFARAIDTRLAFAGVIADAHSSLGIYTIGRCLDRARLLAPSDSTPLADDGAMPSDVADGCRVHGVPLERSWPSDVATINDEPNLSQLEDAARFVVTDLVRIEETGADRVRALQTAIAAGYPVVGGTNVGQDFEDYDGRDLVQRCPPGKSLGGHMLCLGLAYETLSTGVVAFTGANSWGEDWGDRGFFRFGESFLADPQLDDLYIAIVSSTERA